ncbi:MAG: ferrous iron transport protein A [Firmicutes bacterium]|nr:ferrous iron transport protein A [Bacillota bacterium]
MKEGDYTLARLPIGSKGIVVGVEATGSTRRRLLDLGLVPGTVVEAIRRSPLGDPTAFGIRGAIVALREEDGDVVLVRPLW